MNRDRLGLVLALLLVACSPAPSTAPASGPPGSAPPGSAPPTTSRGPSTPAPSVAVPTAEIQALLDSMAAAVVAGDRDAYLALVDTSDPVFATEHTRWANDWMELHPVDAYTIDAADLEVAGDAVIGALSVTWRLEGEVESRLASYAARFTRARGGWRYAGEAWTSTRVPHFVIHVAPGLDPYTQLIADALPSVYEHVTGALDHEPVDDLQIKLYDNPPALVANTLLSLPDISGWNEPGEALKLNAGGTPQALPSVIAHELTHFICFDRAGTKRTRMPWWLDEGIATHVATTLELPVDQGRLARVVAWEAEGELADWDSMAIFEETPVELWAYVYPQGYAMVLFVTERFGEDRRNDWLAAMAAEMAIDAATPAELGMTFDELDTAFRDWLAAQR